MRLRTTTALVSPSSHELSGSFQDDANARSQRDDRHETRTASHGGDNASVMGAEGFGLCKKESGSSPSHPDNWGASHSHALCSKSLQQLNARLILFAMLLK
jgi:hypothetical protein